MSDRVAQARDWALAVHPHGRHLDRTLDWVVELDPEASEALRIAAVTHDIERAFPDPEATWDSARDWDSRAYNRWHQDRCADLVAAWLRDQEADAALVEQVDALVRAHEDGGWPEADLLQAADSLSFLETMVPLVVGWVERGYADNAAAKLRHSLDRIAPDQVRAREAAEPLVDRALAQLGAERGIVRHGTPAATAAAPARDRVLAATALVRTGRVFRLARERFAGMPLFPGHPPFQVLSYRTPQGIRAAGDQPWGPVNDAGLGYMSELVLGSQHTGAHIDAHAHMTVGGEDRWHGGSARTQLGDFGPLTGDATEIPPLWRRGVLYDVPGFRGVDALPAGEPRRRRRAAGDRGGARRRGGGGRRRARPHRLSRRLAGPRGARPPPRRRTRTSPRRGCSRSAASSPSARTPRRSRSSRRPTRASPRTRSRCTRCC